MTFVSRRIALALTMAVALVVGTSAAVSAQSIASFSALAVSPGAPPGQATLSIDILLTRWSSPEERDLVTTTLLEQGPAKLLELLQKMPPVGRLTTPGSTGFALRFAMGYKTGQIDRVLILTDRPVGVWEAQAGARSLDYPFTVIEMVLRPNARGEGQVAVAAKILVDRATRSMSFEDYSVWPVRLQSLRHEMKSQ
jgi:hypothetical protein